MKAKILGVVNGFDFEIEDEFASIEDLHTFTQTLMKHGEFKPRPKFQKDNAAFEPFKGVVEKVEPTKTNNGKDMFIAHVRPDVGEGETAKPLFAVKYMPPQSTWRVGDKVYVDKNEKGWAQLHEQAGEPPF